MKKLSFLLFMTMVLILPASLAHGGKYNSLRFNSDSGEIYTVATNNLEILVDGESLSFSNIDLIIPLSSLVSMEFTDFDDNPAGIDSAIPNSESAVTVFNMGGVIIGSFESYSQALSSLNQGVYVIKDANGNSLKVRVGK